jgi:hypothetical protein
MNDRIEEILRNEFASLSRELVNKYDDLGMRSSGRFERELEVDVRSNEVSFRGVLSGAHYTYQLVNGRRPGRMPPVDAIRQWIRDKRIQLDNISEGSLAYLIARKIAREGTDYFKQGGTDLVSSVVTEDRMSSIVDRVAREVNVIISDSILTTMKESIAV